MKDPRYLFRDVPPYDLSPLIEQEVRYQPLFSNWTELDRLIRQTLQKSESGQTDVRTALAEIRDAAQALLH